MTAGLPSLIFKVTTHKLWAAAGPKGYLGKSPADERDGFMHLSTANQLAQTIELHFTGQTSLVLVAARTADVAAILEWEASRGGALFPHLYGDLPVSAIEWTAPLSVDANGFAPLPRGLGS